jgi:dCMP deaminase
MKEKFIQAHMKAAFVYADLSHCKKRKVGCVIVKEDSILSFGYNGTPAGEDNCCEDEFGITKPNVKHAEYNAIKKLKQHNIQADGAAIIITKIPCIKCAYKIIKARITSVYWLEVSRSNNITGIQLLDRYQIHNEQVTIK